MAPGMAALDDRRVGEAEHGFSGLDEVLTVDDVGRLGHLGEIVDHRHAALAQLPGRLAQMGRIDDGPVAAAQEAQ